MFLPSAQALNTLVFYFFSTFVLFSAAWQNSIEICITSLNCIDETWLNKNLFFCSAWSPFKRRSIDSFQSKGQRFSVTALQRLILVRDGRKNLMQHVFEADTKLELGFFTKAAPRLFLWSVRSLFEVPFNCRTARGSLFSPAKTARIVWGKVKKQLLTPPH